MYTFVKNKTKKTLLVNKKKNCDTIKSSIKSI